MRDMGNDNPSFKEYKERRDAINAVVEKAWKFPDPAAADELAASAAAVAAAKAVKENCSKAGATKKKLTPKHVHALKLAARIRAKEGHSNEGLASSILELWEKPALKKPGHRTICRWLAEKHPP
jgi:hypothetical protein